MSFAFSAALFDENNDSDFLNNKRKHSKTQKTTERILIQERILTKER